MICLVCPLQFFNYASLAGMTTLSVSTSSIRADGSPPLTMLLAVCISEHLVFTVLEQAAEDECACMNVIGYKVCSLVIGVETGGRGELGVALGIIYICKVQ